MDPAKKEFIELFNRSGWSQAEAARHLEMTRGGLNGIVSGDTIPSPATMKLFRYILSDQGIGEGSMMMHDRSASAPESDMEIWKRRAKVAEKELADLKAGMRDLIDKSSSKPLSEAQQIAKRAGDKFDQKNPYAA